ncbi:rhomboid family intramembrane serine protease [Alicyclobacillus sp. SO9]|uniref:rhomboid family intramembrane serine protease n=1 Tax=Alicyclobacillus sp. SO9 TaxID=2665646 RepID=UPI0018E846E5|nr:rhomboid family intramembrane serine protease [Alicyclobacillus sp. SO9]QQE77650.1 rhomboid family intramembrane serine protease [Alicyclobacillus sp. SO9]
MEGGVAGGPPQKRAASNQLWKKAWMTWSLIGVNVVWYVLVEGMTGRSVYGLARAGAFYANAVWHGQWYRLFTAMFVHMNFMHITLNMVSLASLYLIELFFGAWPFAFLYFISGLIGNVVGLWILPGNEVAAGASGAIFGVFAAALVLSFKGYLPKVVRNQLVLLLVINLVYGFWHSNIDNSAHIAGLITGSLVTLSILRWRYHPKVFKSLGVISTVAAVLALAAKLISVT